MYLQDGERHPNFNWLNRNNSTADCSIASKFFVWVCGGYEIVEFIGWCIIDFVIRARTTGATSGGLKLQCIAVAAVTNVRRYASPQASPGESEKRRDCQWSVTGHRLRGVVWRRGAVNCLAVSATGSCCVVLCRQRAKMHQRRRADSA